MKFSRVQRGPRQNFGRLRVPLVRGIMTVGIGNNWMCLVKWYHTFRKIEMPSAVRNFAIPGGILKAPQSTFGLSIPQQKQRGRSGDIRIKSDRRIKPPSK